MVRVIAFGLLLCSSLAGNAQDGRDLVRLLSTTGRTDASPEHANAFLTGIAGTWANLDDPQRTEVLAFSENGRVMYRGRLGDVQVRKYRHRKDLAASRDELDDEAASIQAELAKPDLHPVTETLLNGVQLALLQSAAILDDALATGDGTLAEADLSLRHLPGDGIADPTFRRRGLVVVYSGDRLYIVHNSTFTSYSRVDALGAEQAALWSQFASAAFERSADREYDRLYRRCVEIERAGQPVADCRAHRDGMQDFGVTLKAEFVLERYRDFAKPGQAELDLIMNPVATTADTVTFLPPLDYCYSGSQSGLSYPQFMALLEARGYRNTFWQLAVAANFPAEVPRNWDQPYYNQLQGMIGLDQQRLAQGTVFLREDGIFGYSMGYVGLAFDPRNRWRFAGGRVFLDWHDGAVSMDFDVLGRLGAEGTTGLALYRTAYLQLVAGEFEMLARMQHREAHPRWPELVQQVQTASCLPGSFVELDAATAAELRNGSLPEFGPGAASRTTPPAGPAPVNIAVASAAAITPSPAVAPRPTEPEPASEPPSPGRAPAAPNLVGCWQWSNGANIRINAGGQASTGPVTGQWQAGDGPGNFRIIWPPVTDTITLAADGQSFSATGAFGIQFSAVRVGSGQSLPGQWRRQDGVIINVRADGGAAAGPLNGAWRAADARQFIVEWPMLDQVSVAPDGQSLSAQNQFGAVTAVREACR